MSNIEIHNLTFGYTDQLIFQNASINIDDKWKLGLVGRNGRGKTTLLKIIMGQIKSEINVKSKKHFVYFPQEIQEHNQLTLFVLQELALFEQWKLERELKLLEVDLSTLWRPFNSLSGGEQTKMLLALLFLDENDTYPLIDEPTNHLDKASREKVAAYLAEKKGYILVSHDRNFLNKTTDHTLAIERADLQMYAGNFAVYEKEKRLRDLTEKAQDDKLKKEIGRLKQTAREKEVWSRNLEATKSRKKRGFDSETKRVDKGYIGRKSANMMQKSKNLEKRMKEDIVAKELLLKNWEDVPDLEMIVLESHHKRLLTAENLTAGFEELLFQPVSFILEKGEVIAFTGENGIGKSSLMKVITGKFTGRYNGSLELNNNLVVSEVRQIAYNRGFLSEFAKEENLDLEIFMNNLRKLGIEREVFNQKIENMSQGQQRKIELARSLTQPAHIYLWDEPLNYLDVFNQEQIIKTIKKSKPSMIIIEHDESFIERVADKKIELFTKN
ncbi:ribosomal protection-like ABC-F family protein [Enterococcus faecalis]|uniref:ribosomal protection-like ABC-F family protein n=1 Tax=Enterococcus faecalis TaxID=1351 RepID=UPI0012D2C861|nr:ATP-binding cassette domain-containing protein [Enterococcus faecalis]QTO65480.1 ABC-F family ATP-binding cassette domain-containing protein [Enterococcus faecalis]